jgi:DNA-binding winged helix-turn-helix (wHTH) protein/tetratricopeptide (TPR) repeat protein
VPRRWKFVEHDLKLACEDREVRLAPKAAAVLACLLRRKGSVVSQAELLSEVWSGVDVSPDLVREYVFDLRSALEDSAQSPEFIETVRGRGIRLIGDIEIVLPPVWRRRPVIRIERTLISNSASAYSDELVRLENGLLDCLAGMTDVAAVGPDVDASEAVSADYTLKARLTPRSRNLQVNFRLIEEATEASIWSRRLETSNRGGLTDLDHLAAVASNEIASWRGAIMRAEATKAKKIAPEARKAHHHYALALAHERQRDGPGTEAGLRHIERSLELEPENARGWLLLWHILERPFILLGEPFTESVSSRCRSALTRAFQTDPDDPLILVNVCGERARNGDFGGAAVALERAAQIGWNQADVMSPCANKYASVAGDINTAQKHLAQAHALNPMVKDWLRFTTARVNFFAANFDACLLATGRAPDLLPLTLFRALSLALLNRRREAKLAYRSMRALFPRVDLEAYANQLPITAASAREMYDEAVRRL